MASIVVLSAIERSLSRASQAIDKVAELVTSVALAAVVLINALEIISRTVFDDSQTWVYETNLLLANWIYFIGIVAVYYRKKDVVVELFVDRLKLKVRTYYLILLNVITMSVMSILVFYGWRLIDLQSRMSTLDLHIPNHLFSLPVVAGAAAVVVIVAAQSVEMAHSNGSGDATRP